MSTLAERVRQAREACRMGMNELDRAIGQGSGYTSKLESGTKKHPVASIMQQMAEALGVSADWLISGVGEMAPPPKPRLVRDNSVYTTLEPVLAGLRAKGEDPAVLAALEAERNAPGRDEMTHEDWLKRAQYWKAFFAGRSTDTGFIDPDFDVIPGKH